MSNISTVFVCRECLDQFGKWHGQCPSCGEWNSLEEREVEKKRSKKVVKKAASSSKVISFAELPMMEESRIVSGIDEFDRVVGGGIVPGSLILLGGEPGVGKSTILLQVSSAFAKKGFRCLYVSGEESSAQIRTRGERLGIQNEGIEFLGETNLEDIISQLELTKPDIVMIDSIQTVRSDYLESSAGSVSQVRETANGLLDFAKKENTTVFITGHVTKEGAIAGPKSIEHIVDTVLYFEGEKNYRYRVIRATKNRFGATGEIGIFEMRREGLVPVKEASTLFVSSSVYENPGSVVFPSCEGTRPLLVEIQALVGHPGYTNPRRTIVGIDYNRAILVLAILEKRLGLELSGREVFISVAGGVFVNEPASDLAVASAVISSYYDKPIRKDSAIFGEVGLTGEVRGVSLMRERLKESSAYNFGRNIIPKSDKINVDKLSRKIIIEIENLNDLLERLF